MTDPVMPPFTARLFENGAGVGLDDEPDDAAAAADLQDMFEDDWIEPERRSDAAASAPVDGSLASPSVGRASDPGGVSGRGSHHTDGSVRHAPMPQHGTCGLPVGMATRGSLPRARRAVGGIPGKMTTETAEKTNRRLGTVRA